MPRLHAGRNAISLFKISRAASSLASPSLSEVSIASLSSDSESNVNRTRTFLEAFPLGQGVLQLKLELALFDDGRDYPIFRPVALDLLQVFFIVLAHFIGFFGFLLHEHQAAPGHQGLLHVAVGFRQII